MAVYEQCRPCRKSVVQCMIAASYLRTLCSSTVSPIQLLQVCISVVKSGRYAGNLTVSEAFRQVRENLPGDKRCQRSSRSVSSDPVYALSGSKRGAVRRGQAPLIKGLLRTVDSTAYSQLVHLTCGSKRASGRVCRCCQRRHPNFTSP